jgi:CheY-like chemotaxis protein
MGEEMATLPGAAPLTPLEELRALLSRQSDEEGVALQLHHLLLKLRQMALPELGARLLKPTVPKAQKGLILALTHKFDWPEWAPHLLKFLQQENDLGLFDEGCAALGRLETRQAYDALQTLLSQRGDPDRRLILNRELHNLQPTQPFAFFLGRLMEGEGNSRLAHQGARFLAVLASPEDLPALAQAYQEGDSLTSRLVLRIVSGLPGGQAGEFLLGLFERLGETLADYTALEPLLLRLQTLPRTQAREELARDYAERLAARCPEGSAALLAALEQEEGDLLGPLDALAPFSHGPVEAFLLEAVQVLAEGKVARFTALLAERLDQAQTQQVELARHLDQCAEALLRQVREGFLDRDRAMPALASATQRFPEAEGVALAFAWLVAPADEARLSLILAIKDPKRRTFLLDAVGAREEDAFTPFFLKAMQDPIVEVGQRAIHHLARLPSAFPVVMGMFESGQNDQMRNALRIFRENRIRAAAETLTAFLGQDARDELVVEAVEALGAIRYPPATRPLLDLLHDGKPVRLQLALAHTLAELHTPEAALGLLAKAPGLKLPQVLILCLEGVLGAFQGFDHPLPADALPDFEALLTRCLDEREGEGQHLRALLATQGLYCFDQPLYARWRDRFSDILFDLRTKGGWDRETNDQVAAVIKELGQRSAALNLIAGKEEALLAKMRGVPDKGPGRSEALLNLRELVGDPELILRPDTSAEIAAWVAKELARPGQDWREQARLCEIGGALRQESLIEPIRDLYQRASGLGLRSAAKESLARLGLSEADMNRRPPVTSILLLEPSGFFRKKVKGVLEAHWRVVEAANRAEAETILAQAPVDLILSELHDGEGDLRAWLTGKWEAGRTRLVLLATATRDLGELADQPWLLGAVFKPFQPESLLSALEP